MQIIRTIVWVLLTAMVVAFVAMNWTIVPVNFWPIGDHFLSLKWPIGLIALFFFLLGLLPMWLLSKAGRWRLKRQLVALENSVRAIDPAPPAVVPPATAEPIAIDLPGT